MHVQPHLLTSNSFCQIGREKITNDKNMKNSQNTLCSTLVCWLLSKKLKNKPIYVNISLQNFHSEKFTDMFKFARWKHTQVLTMIRTIVILYLRFNCSGSIQFYMNPFANNLAWKTQIFQNCIMDRC